MTMFIFCASAITVAFNLLFELLKNFINKKIIYKMTSPRDYLAKILCSTAENLEDTPPPEHFDTPIPPRPKPRLNRKHLIKNMFNRKLTTIAKPIISSPERRICVHTDNPVYDKVEAISIRDLSPPLSSSSSRSSESDYEYFDDEEESAGDESGKLDATLVSPDTLKNCSSSSDPEEKTISTIGDLFKSFLFVDVGPNITDTVNEFTSLLADVATRNK